VLRGRRPRTGNTFTAKDSQDKTCKGTVTVGVPHKRGGHSTPSNFGCEYDSFRE
jgi:hypothetical protein